jgi:hypothetical protein
MSPQRKREVASWITILVGMTTLFASAKVWANSAYVTTPRYDRDRTADSAWKAESRAISLETLCAVKPHDWRCR